MLKWTFATRGGNRWLLAALAIQISGCMAYNNTSSDFDRVPIVNTGTRAAIIYPGQGAPAMPGSAPNAQYAPPGAGSQYGQPPVPEQQPPYPSSAPVPPGVAPTPQPYANPQSGSAPDGQISFLGGSRMEESRHVDIRKEPLVVKYLTAPFKLVAAPFVLAKEALEGEPEPGPAIPRRPDPPTPQRAIGSGDRTATAATGYRLRDRDARGYGAAARRASPNAAARSAPAGERLRSSAFPFDCGRIARTTARTRGASRATESSLTPRTLGVGNDPSEPGTRRSLSDREWNRRSQQRRPDRSMDLSRRR